ncbi:hypothetical protein FACS1894139_05620 [Planctomycetales bacterium]|nr:hypothetical protein FACS1894139_05620 [Planctomycetales bacterium]
MTAVFCVGTAGLFVYLENGLPQRSFSPTKFLDRAAVRKKIQDRLSFVINSLPQLPQNLHRAFTGQEGWLFLGNDYEACLDKLTGKISPAIRAQSESSSAAIITQLKQYDGVKKIVFVGPNKSSIYPEFLPSDVRPSNQRYINPILQKFQESGLDVFDPTEILLNAKKEKLLYYRTDTHWNSFGAYLAVKGMLEHLGFTSEIIEASFKGLDFVNGSPHRGDLIDIGKFNLDAVAGDNFLPEWNPSHSDLTLIEHNGAQYPLSPTAAVGTPKFNEPIRIINPHATTKMKIWLVRDSFSSAASPFFHAIFAETLHINRGDNLSVLNYAPPDIIIYEGVERSF